jgi:hypothetical protein
MKARAELAAAADPYAAFRRIRGEHPYRRAVPGGHVDYRARRRRGAAVTYFNFALAREMGLIPRDHAATLTKPLARAVLDTFALRIVNEYDVARRGVRPSPWLLGPYMATRYLQLQHVDRRGTTSGDGRSIWNGTVRSSGTTWDISSCGTGVTRLCPATAARNRFYATGSRTASYGCGTASVGEGLAAALMSESFLKLGIATERCLAVISLPDGFAVNVRAGKNLLRPSHLFAPLKQNDLPRLRGAVDYAVARERGNGRLPRGGSAADAYRALAEHVAESFGRAAATFEREYVFCWMDWDGDNVLLDGGIVDFGSVRRFGLYHREYRYDDGPRWSTTLPEQKRKARDLVRCMAQIREALLSGARRPLRDFRADPLLDVFDRSFADTRDRLLLRHMGFDRRAERELMGRARPLLRRFDLAHDRFERVRSRRGRVRVPDGITWNAIYSTRDLLRELPRLFARDPEPVSASLFLAIAASSYARRADRKPTRARSLAAREFQSAYLALVRRAARLTGRPTKELLQEMATRAGAANTYARMTGDAVAHAAARLSRARRRIGPDAMYEIVDRLASLQSREPAGRSASEAPRDELARKAFDDILGLLVSYRDGL